MANLLPPVAAIRKHMAGFEQAVDLENFGTRDPAVIAGQVSDFCARHLGSGVAGYLFCTASQGSTHGIALDDGRRVVLKVRPVRDGVAQAGADDGDGRLTRQALGSVCRAQHELVRQGFACPKPLIEPTPFGQGVATVETYLEEGEEGDGSDPAYRSIIAAGLSRVIQVLTPIRDRLLGLRPFFPLGESRYPVPHNKIFDFEATSKGAEWIDAIADRARARAVGTGDLVVGHMDWRIEHLRFAEGRISASYDWDSIQCLPETQVVGAAAASFSADWSKPAPGIPTLQGIRAFVPDYESARGEAFTGAERAATFAMAVYTIAYGARCGHSLQPDLSPSDWSEDTWPGLLRVVAEPLLEEVWCRDPLG